MHIQRVILRQMFQSKLQNGTALIFNNPFQSVYHPTGIPSAPKRHLKYNVTLLLF